MRVSNMFVDVKVRRRIRYRLLLVLWLPVLLLWWLPLRASPIFWGIDFWLCRRKNASEKIQTL